MAEATASQRLQQHQQLVVLSQQPTTVLQKDNENLSKVLELW